MIKRMFDLLLASIAFVTLLPLMLLVAAAIALESGFPVLFRQVRVGRNCQPFGMYKFRSMVRNAASIGPHFTSDHDPRVTRVGRFIRSTSIDELPQLFNVLLGHMSLVGPRPDVPAQIVEYTSESWSRRHFVRPGITGLAQARLRSLATPEQRQALDLEYVANQSLWLDLKIILMTLGRLSGRGSN